jgi:hypothetical protein
MLLFYWNTICREGHGSGWALEEGNCPYQDRKMLSACGTQVRHLCPSEIHRQCRQLGPGGTCAFLAFFLLVRYSWDRDLAYGVYRQKNDDGMVYPLSLMYSGIKSLHCLLQWRQRIDRVSGLGYISGRSIYVFYRYASESYLKVYTSVYEQLNRNYANAPNPILGQNSPSPMQRPPQKHQRIYSNQPTSKSSPPTPSSSPSPSTLNPQPAKS